MEREEMDGECGVGRAGDWFCGSESGSSGARCVGRRGRGRVRVRVRVRVRWLRVEMVCARELIE
jgi:hypothetical protein